MHINTPLADKVFALLAKSPGKILVAESTSWLFVFRSGYLFHNASRVRVIDEAKLIWKPGYAISR